MKLQKRIPDGVSLPRFYGMAWFDACMMEVVCYPMPFHWIARITTHIWGRFKYTYLTSFEKELMRENAKGYRRGWNSHREMFKAQFEREFGRKL